jgi:hypothetical protein
MKIIVEQGGGVNAHFISARGAIKGDAEWCAETPLKLTSNSNT